MGKHIVIFGALTGALFFGGTRAANAHFVLQAPNAMYQQDPGSGLPEKSAPCGQADSGGPVAVATNAVNTFTEGQQVTITITEVVPHPGHYRVALAASPTALPADPLPSGATACSQATVQSTPSLPIIADNVLVHTSPFSGPQTFTVTLPAGFTCTNCTLQVIELMTDHTPSSNCFYHHCATVMIQAPTATGSGGATGSGTGTGGGPPTTTGSAGAVGTGSAGSTGTGSGGSPPVTGASGSVGTGAAGVSGTGAAGTTGSAGRGGSTGAGGSTGTGTGTGTGSGTGTAGSTGVDGGTGGSSSGGCSFAAGPAASGAWATLLLVGVALSLRRRRSR